MQKEDTFELKLISPIKIHGKVDGRNELVEADVLTFHCFSYKHNFQILPLRQSFMQALFSSSKAMGTLEKPTVVIEEEEKEDKIDAKAFLAILSVAGESFDISKFYTKFLDFFSNGTCTFQGRRVNRGDLDKIGIEDLEQMVGKYAEFFLLSLWLKNLSAQ